MQVGLLWFDDDKKRTLEEKVQRAVAHYFQKFGQRPSVCYLNPGTMNGGPQAVSGVQLCTAKNVLLHHFWIGLEESAAGVNSKARSNGGVKK